MADLTKITNFSQVTLGTWPTPIESYNLPQIKSLKVKRDDLSCYGRGGAKTRKIEGLLTYMQQQKYQKIITVGGNITNAIFDLLQALKERSLKYKLFIIDDPPAGMQERQKIFSPILQNISLGKNNRIKIFLSVIKQYIKDRKSGIRSCLILPGLSHPSAIIGNALGLIEMAQQLKSSEKKLPHTVYITAATGSTIAGFLLAAAVLKKELGTDINIVGVQVYSGFIKLRTWLFIKWTRYFLGLRANVFFKDININKDYLQGGFGKYNNTIEDKCLEIEQITKIKLDPIFSGKTWLAMEKHWEGIKKDLADDSYPLFWHCGYTPEWKILKKSTQK